MRDKAWRVKDYKRPNTALKRLASAVRFRPWPPFSMTYKPVLLSLVAFGCTFTTLLTAPALLLWHLI